MKFGDKVRIEILDERAGMASVGYVIGLPGYSRGYEDVVQTAADDFIGMPVNAKWCAVIGEDIEKARQLRDRFDSQFPTFLTTSDNPADQPNAVKPCADCGEPTDVWHDGTHLCWKCRA